MATYVKLIKGTFNYMWRHFVRVKEQFCITYLPEEVFAINYYETPSQIQNNRNSSSNASVFEDIFGNGFLWAVPRSRRSIEKRLTRKMGQNKMLVPKKNILICNECGHFHEAHTICGNCYEKVKQETQLLQEEIQKELSLEPVEKEVVIVYQKEPKDYLKVQGKRIVEIPRERPSWFSKNILEKTYSTNKAKH
ncbi:39S ribosomal protein L32, mitochondrial-like [Limulus polyphemus]|uniref:Large ribosomal subunit protein bL32m n=1 Tax=Limulus polyphemus TaxID=6850 RepID=A0ABM1BQI2_LIMPO|nr:39S ribosomal protein L32, mitochondrial-like [Limulus polyphemus]